MDIKQMQYFVSIAQEGSYSRAAEKLSVSQPALSIAIKKLEEEFGVKLFYYFDRRQRLTDEGARFFKNAKELLHVYQRTIEDIQSAETAASGSFTLGLSPLFGACFFGDLIPNFSTAYPNIKINMIEDGAEKINQLIENGSVDLAVTLYTGITPQFGNCHFSTQRNVALLHKTHPFAERKTLTVADLRQESFAIFNQDFILNRQIMEACRIAGFQPKIALLSSQWDFMVELVSKNRAVSILPKPVLERHSYPDIRYIPLTDSLKYWDVVLAWNKEKYMPKPCRLFLEYIQQHLPPDDV